MSNFLINSLQFGDGKYTITLPELDVFIDNNGDAIRPDHFHFLTTMDMPTEDGMMMVVDFKNILELINSTISGQVDIIGAVKNMVRETNSIKFEFVNSKYEHSFILQIDPDIDVYSLFASSAIVQVDDVNVTRSIAHVSLLNYYKYQHTHSASYTPEGTISEPAFTGDNIKYEPSGTIDAPTFTGTGVSYTPAGTITTPEFKGTGVSYIPAGTITTPEFKGTGVSYTPAGTVTQPTFSGTTATVTSDAKETVTGVTYNSPSLTGGNFPTVTSSKTNVSVINSITPTNVINSVDKNTTNIGVTGNLVEGTKCLNISLASGISGSGINVVTGITSSTTTASVVVGTGTEVLTAISVGDDGSFPILTGGSIDVSTGTHTHNTTITPSGTVTQPTFAGTTATITAAGTVTQPTFAGTTATITAAGTVTQPTFAGTTATITAKGTVSAPKFSGTTATITVKGTVSAPKFSGTTATITVS